MEYSASRLFRECVEAIIPETRGGERKLPEGSAVGHDEISRQNG
jgi:hypothetical protein